jgi:hypothetical protein
VPLLYCPVPQVIILHAAPPVTVVAPLAAPVLVYPDVHLHVDKECPEPAAVLLLYEPHDEQVPLVFTYWLVVHETFVTGHAVPPAQVLPDGHAEQVLPAVPVAVPPFCDPQSDRYLPETQLVYFIVVGQLYAASAGAAINSIIKTEKNLKKIAILNTLIPI